MVRVVLFYLLLLFLIFFLSLHSRQFGWRKIDVYHKTHK